MPQKRAFDLSTDERAEMLRNLEFGSRTSESAIVRLAKSSAAADYRRRRFVYRAGEAADSIFIITRGRIKLCRIEENSGREAVIDILSVGAMFGESALFGAGLREKNAVAYENSRVLRVPLADFRDGMAENRDLYDYTFALIGQRLLKAEHRLADFALDAIPARLEKLLIEYSGRYGVLEADGVLIDIPLPHREIASIVGSTRESVTVRLNALRREGIIDFVNRRILIKRPDSLAVEWN
ncbi:MAG: family transcriptional regulator, cyclic receptor protein [Blastocatellia bacterium]|nr:family transcriptional regulator, cyclic receptor protein [Blastocatellia bacterium]